MLALYGTKIGVRAARKHLSWYMDGAPAQAGSRAGLRRAILTDDDPARVLGRLAAYFSADPEARAA